MSNEHNNLQDDSMGPEANYFLNHPMITSDRDTDRGFYTIGRWYPNNEVECCAIKLESDQRLKLGGGAKRKKTKKEEMDAIVLQKSQSRARTKVRRHCLAISADNLLTLTFKENVTNIEEAWKTFNYFARLMNKKFPKSFLYIAVPEYQKRGAVHFHLAIQGFYHHKAVRSIWRKAAGKRGGNIDFSSAKNKKFKHLGPRDIASYLAKYITKNDIVAMNKKRYSVSRGIIHPQPMRCWVPSFAPVIYVIRDALHAAGSKPIATVRDISGGFYPLIYFTT